MASAYDPIIIVPVPEEPVTGTDYYAVVVLNKIPSQDEQEVTLDVEDGMMDSLAAGDKSKGIKKDQVAYVYKVKAQGSGATLQAYTTGNDPISIDVTYT